MTTYTYTTLDYLGPYRTFLYDINSDGQIIGQYTTYGVNFLYSTSDSTFTPLSNLDSPFGSQTYAYASGINDSGQIVGTWNYIGDLPGASHGFLYSNGNFVSIDVPFPSVYGTTFAASINDLTQIVGSYPYAPFLLHGFLYSGNVYTDIVYPLDTSGLSIGGVGVSTGTVGINNLGQIVGDYSYIDGTSGQTFTHGFTYNINSGVYTPLDYAGAISTVLTGINDLGQIVGYYDDATGRHGFVDNGGVFTLLDSPYVPSGIDDAGDIVGTYFDGSIPYTGAYRGFLATPVITNHVPQIDVANSTLAGAIHELPNVTGNLALDIATGAIAFTDADLSDRPTANVIKQTVVYHDAHGNDDTTQLTSAQIDAIENSFLIVPEAGNANNGKSDWFFSAQDDSFDFLGTGEALTLTTQVQVDDHNGGTVAEDITVTVTGANDAPIAIPDIVSVQKGATFSADKAHGVLANDTDPDIHDILTLSAVNGSASLIGHPIKGTFGTLTLAADGSYTYVMKNNAPVGAQDVFQYTVSDGHGGISTSTLTLQIPYPALAISSAMLTGSVNERLLVTGSNATDSASPGVITFNVPDPVNRPTATVDAAHQTITWQDSTHDYTSQLTAAELAAIGSAFSFTQTDNANTGKVTWTYKIKDSALDFLGTNETLTVTTPVVIDDHHGNVATENVVVTVTGADDKPVVSGPIVSTASEDDAPYAIDLLQLASDPDTNDVLHVANVTGLAAGVTLVGHALHVDPNAYNALSVGQHTTVDVRYSVVDETGNSVQERTTITINGANDAPSAVPDAATVQTGSKVTGNVLTNDSDPDAHDVLHVSGVSFGNTNTAVSAGHPGIIDGSYGTLTVRTDGSYSYAAHASLQGNGQDQFSYSVDDGHGGAANSTLTVTHGLFINASDADGGSVDQTFTNDPTAKAAFEAAVQTAKGFFENTFTNDVTLNIKFGFEDLGTNGGHGKNGYPAQSYYSFDDIKQALNATATHGDKYEKVADGTLIDDPTSGDFKGQFLLTQAEAKALGLTLKDTSNFSDGTVWLNRACLQLGDSRINY